MNTKKVSLIIISLCIISIFVGILGAIFSGVKRNVEASSSGISSVFSAKNKIALIDLEGEISSESSGNLFGDVYSASGVYEALKRAYKDSSVKGVVLKINSPGGTVGMSQEIYSSILRLRKKKPVVVSMGDVAASGGYYISSAADRIWANPGTLTGSIGVIFSTYDMHQLLNQKLGITTNVIKSGKFKDIGSSNRPMRPDERQLLQNIINTTYKEFVDAIIVGRVQREDNYNVKVSKLTVKNLRQYADGRVFTGLQAKQLGFVDQVGGLYEAESGIQKMVKERFNLGRIDLPVVQYNRSAGLGDMFLNASESLFKGKGVDLSLPIGSKYPHQLLYLWE